MEACCRESSLMQIEGKGEQSVTGPLLLIRSFSGIFSAIYAG
jgi:hypothetical protein